MESPVDESRRSNNRGVDALLGEQDRVTGGLGELLDAGSDVDGVTDQGELQLACAADGAGDPELIPMPIRSPPPNRSTTRR